MTFIYWALAILTLYGDLLKRHLPPKEVLMDLYAAAFAVLIGIMLINFRKKVQKDLVSEESKSMSFFIWLLMGLYLLEFFLGPLLSRDASIRGSFSSTLYVCIPWAYTLVILRFYPQFNLAKLSYIYFLLMIPINAVGLIQYAVNPDFFISTAYLESGGVIKRNLLSGGSFLRFPSIFVSADRYSGIALIQSYFALLVLLSPKKKEGWRLVWLVFNLFSGVVALLISGARSRILILLAVAVLLVITLMVESFSLKRWSKIMRALQTSVLGFLLFCMVTIFALILAPDSVSEGTRWISDFPVVSFLKDSFREGDIQDRLEDTYGQSLPSEEISWFGKGSDVLEKGRPAELGIRALWEESGILGGTAILLCYAAILFILGSLVMRALVRGQIFRVAVFSFPCFVLLTALFVGLAFVLEYSSGILWAVSLGAIMAYGRIKRRSKVVHTHVMEETG